MDAADLQDGFRVGEWLVEPRSDRARSHRQTVGLAGDPLRLLVVLAVRHGEAVERRELCAQLWPGDPGCEDKLRDAVITLRTLLGDTRRQQRYVASVGHDALALVAHFELSDRPATATATVATATSTATPLAAAGFAAADPAKSAGTHPLISELRRRGVIKVGASYLLVAWLVLQVAQVTFAPLRFPAWWMTALTIIAIIGFPIVVVLAWAYEISPTAAAVEPGAGGAGTVSLRRPRPRQSLAPYIVGGVALMAGVTGLAWWRSLEDLAMTPTAPLVSSAEQGGPKSIAVLPLVDMSPAGGNGWLGDGLSEELSTRLAQIPGLRVAARTSAFEYKDKNIDVRRIGQSLGVRHVLEGSVRREGDGLRVTVQLIDTNTGYHVWAGNFDRAWSDLLSLQSDVARSVADALQIVLTSQPRPPGPTPTGTLDTRALEPYLEGLALVRQPADPSLLQRAENAFRAAIAIAPELTGAHAGLCRVLGRRFDQTRDRAVLEQAEQSCRRALELDATLVETEKALAGLYVSDGRFAQAVETYRKILARDPRDADAHIGLGEALGGVGQGQQAEASLREATAADPSYWRAYAALGRFMFERGRVDEAIGAYRRMSELVPSSASAWSNLGAALQLKGNLADAEKAFQKSLLLEPGQNAYSNLATTEFMLGDFVNAVRNYERAVALAEHDHIVRGNLADALWQIPGRREEAAQTYRKAIELAEAELAATPSDPTLRAQLGYYYGRAGDPERSTQYIEEATRNGADLIYVQYYRGVAAADRGDRAAALAAVADLVRMGYPPVALRSAPEFRSLLHDAEYKKIVGAGPG